LLSDLYFKEHFDKYKTLHIMKHPVLTTHVKIVDTYSYLFECIFVSD